MARRGSLSRGEAMLLAKEIATAIKEGEKLLERYGPDHEDGTIIAFSKQFPTHVPVRLELPAPEDVADGTYDLNPGDLISGMTRVVNTHHYHYAAIRTNGQWFTTGPKSPKGYEWEELVDWFDLGVAVDHITVLREGFSPQLISAGIDPSVDDTLIEQYLRSGLEGHGVDPDDPKIAEAIKSVLETISGIGIDEVLREREPK